MERMDKLCLDGIYSQGFGTVPKFVMHDQELTLESKAIYSYLCALAGSGDATFPYRNTILRDLRVSKDAYYRHYNLLLEQGYISVTRPSDKKAANIYTLIQNPKKLPEQPSQKGPGRLMYRGLKAHGYGSLPRSVMLDESLSIKAKGLYAYLCSYCGGGNCAFPKKDDILFHLGISEPTYYKALNQLKNAGYLETCQRKDEKGQFDVNDYFLNEYSASATGKPPDNLESKPGRSAPNKANHTEKPKARLESGMMPPLPRKPDMENPDTRKPDIRNTDAISNNSNSSNNLSINNPSIAPKGGEDGRIELQSAVENLMEELIEKPPRKNQETAVAAREYLVRVWKDGGENRIAQLQEEFVFHLQVGLRDKRVRNLKAYCRTALYNWLSEQPVREEVRVGRSIPREKASYDLRALEWIVESGDFSDVFYESL